MRLVLRIYTTLIIGLAAICFAAGDWSVPSSLRDHWNAVGAFVVVCFLAEAYYFRLKVGRTETQASVSFIPYIASVLLFPGPWAALVTGLSMAGVELFVRRKAAIRTFFNGAQVVISISAAAVAFKLLGGNPSLDVDLLQMPPIAIAAAVAVYFALNSAAVSIAVTLASGEALRDAWLRIGGSSFVYDVFSSPFGPLLAYLYARFEVPGILILVLPLYFIRHIYQVNLQLEQVNRDLLELMVKAIEARDPYTSGHSQRVSQLAELLAKQLGLGAKLVEQVKTAALLHDVGKIHEEYAPLLRKEGKLDPTEKALMQTHSIRSAELVGTISAFKGSITDSVRHHHENYDGSGYPSGLAGKAIPVGARIIMIADTVDAMTTDRPYRAALPFERVAEELDRYSGSQFDPQLVAAFMQSTSIKSVIFARVQGKATPLELSQKSATHLPWRKAARKERNVK